MTLAFVVELQGGLANRLRALWSAHAFALRYRRPVVALWPITAELGCAHQELFTLNRPVLLISVDLAHPLQRLSLQLARWVFSGFRFGLNRPIDKGESWGRPPRFAPRWMPFQWIQTCTEFEDSQHLVAPFTPLPYIQQLASERLAEARSKHSPVLGVHIRRQDHQRAIAGSDTSSFVSAMQEHLKRHPATHFILCTDDPSEVELLRTLFGARLFWFSPSSLDRSQSVAVIDSFVDFLVLAGCDSILGSHLSSFSLLSARYGKRGLHIAGSCQDSEQQK